MTVCVKKFKVGSKMKYDFAIPARLNIYLTWKQNCYSHRISWGQDHILTQTTDSDAVFFGNGWKEYNVSQNNF